MSGDSVTLGKLWAMTILKTWMETSKLGPGVNYLKAVKELEPLIAAELDRINQEQVRRMRAVERFKEDLAARETAIGWSINSGDSMPTACLRLLKELCPLD